MEDPNGCTAHSWEKTYDLARNNTVEVTGSEEARGILCSRSLDHQNKFVESRAQMRSMGGFGV